MIRSVKKCSNDHLKWNENQNFSVVCRRGSMLSTAIFVYAATSPVNGYFGGSLYSKQGGNKRPSFAVLSPKPLKLTWFYLNVAGRRWIKQMFIGAFMIPSMVCGTAFFINFIAIYYHASRAIPFGTMVSFTFTVLKERRLVVYLFVVICSSSWGGGWGGWSIEASRTFVEHSYIYLLLLLKHSEERWTVTNTFHNIMTSLLFGSEFSEPVGPKVTPFSVSRLGLRKRGAASQVCSVKRLVVVRLGRAAILK